MTTSKEVPISLKIHLDNMKNIIEVQHLKYKYDHHADDYILKDVTFHVKQGEWLSIVGHNGSGKSTTIRLIDGLLEAESGEIIIDGDKLTLENVWEKRQHIGMVFKEREPARLSGGQKQRVAIAGVVALRPDIIILDEATSMLDPEGRLELIQTVKKIKDRHGMTVISITHDLDEVALSDRVLVMKEGQVESTSTPSELFSRVDLEDLGLDEPFTNQVKETLLNSGFQLPERYLTEKELQDYLWESL